jgi:protein SCO1/2
MTLTPPRMGACSLFLALCVAIVLCKPTQAHDPQDKVLEQIGVDEKLGARLPLELPFTDQGGRSVKLSSYFTGGPVILTLNYYSCPTLCPLVFRNMVNTIHQMGNFQPGRDFRIVAVSIDPGETRQRAGEKAAATYATLGPTAGDPDSAWPFLLGGEASVGRLAKALGIRYTRAENGEFAHPNVIVIATPDGRIARYLYGIEQAPKDLKLALIEASGGAIGGSTVVNRALLYCFHYDPVGKKYVLLASRLMTAAMAGVLLVTVGLIALLWKRERPAA